MKPLQNACILRLPKDYSSVMSLSMPSELWMVSYWGKQPSNTVVKNCVAEMQQNGFLQVTCSATRNLKRKNIVNIHNELLEGEICHMPQLEATRDYLSVISESDAQLFKAFFKHTFDLNFKAASACIGRNNLWVLFCYFCNKERMFHFCCLYECPWNSEFASAIHLHVRTVASIWPGFYLLPDHIVYVWSHGM